MKRGERFKIEFYLSCLVPNMQTATDALPTLDEMLEAYTQNAALREKIGELAHSDGVSRFYAALLLWPVDNAKTETIFDDLQDDETTLTVQKSLGFGAVEIPIYLLADDFRTQDLYPGEHLSRIEALANWQSSIAATAHGRQGDAEDELPRYEEALEAKTNAQTLKNLRPRLEKLKTSGAAERFYAAALINLIDETEARAILEELLEDPSQVGILRGDVMTDVPAARIAAELLGRAAPNEPASEKQNPIAHFFKWLGG